MPDRGAPRRYRHQTGLEHRLSSNQPTRAALYARVSTKGKGQDLGLQLDDLKALASQRGWTPTIYQDEGVSGSKRSRPGLDAMMRDIHHGKIDVVVVWRFDRFARSLQHLVAALDDFRTRGVAFVSHYEAIDTNTAMGRMVFQIVGALAEFERELIRERVQAGVDRARAKGTRLGRPPERVLDLATISELLRGGMSLRAVARALGAPLTSVRRAGLQIAATVDPTPPSSAEARGAE